MKVVKFGGSSLADANQIKKVCDIITSDIDRRIIVVSAPGKRSKDDIKVTDLLISLAQSFIEKNQAEEELMAVVERYRSIAQDLGLSNEIGDIIEQDLRERLKIGTDRPELLMDSLKAAGEDNCAKLVAEYLRSIGIDAQYVNPGDAGLNLSDEFGNAQVLEESYQNLSSLKNSKHIVIFPGFFGYSKSGDIVTFPRGGSDITGSILAAAVGADLYENFTDVDYVYSANPNIIENPKPVPEFTYREMRELSYAGFSVLQEETLLPVYKAGVPVNIKNTNNPSERGTLILPQREYSPGQVVGIAGDEGYCSIYLSKYLMNREIGFGRKLLQILEEEGLSYEHSPSGVDNISIILKQNQITEGKEEVVLKRIKNELQVDEIYIEYDLAVVLVVGEGMKSTVGMASRATKALKNSNVNLEMISQGSSEISIMFCVRADNCKDAITALYKEFFND